MKNMRNMSRRENQLLGWWQEAQQDFPRKSLYFQMRMAIEYFNAANPNNPANESELSDALDKKGDQ